MTRSPLENQSDIAVSLVGISHGFRGTAVIGDINLDIRRHEFLSIIGPSGCGKSTLLRIIAGLVAPDSGVTHVEGRPLEGPGPDRVLVPQHESLLPWRTALANVELGLQIQGVPRAERRARSRSMLATVGLADAANLRPNELSGGMRQRCQIARALVVEPKVLLLDEPLSALDWQARRVLQEVLLRLTVDQTTVMVTHDVDEAAFLSDRIMVLSAGPGRRVEMIEANRQLGSKGRSSYEQAGFRERILAALESVPPESKPQENNVVVDGGC